MCVQKKNNESNSNERDRIDGRVRVVEVIHSQTDSEKLTVQFFDKD